MGFKIVLEGFHPLPMSFTFLRNYFRQPHSLPLHETEVVERADALARLRRRECEEQRMFAIVILQGLNRQRDLLLLALGDHLKMTQSDTPLGLRRTVQEDLHRTGSTLGQIIDKKLQIGLAVGLGEIKILVSRH